MARTLTGVKIENDTKGNPKMVTIDLGKNPELHDILIKAGILKVAKIVRKRKPAMTIEEFKKGTLIQAEAVQESLKLAKKWPKIKAK